MFIVPLHRQSVHALEGSNGTDGLPNDLGPDGRALFRNPPRTWRAIPFKHESMAEA